MTSLRDDTPTAPDLSIVVVRLARTSDPAAFLESLQREADRLGVACEIITAPTDSRGFGHELRHGISLARAPFVITADPDYAGPMNILADLWARRHDAEVIIASRYVAGGRAEMPKLRAFGSRLLNLAFRRG